MLYMHKVEAIQAAFKRYILPQNPTAQVCFPLCASPKVSHHWLGQEIGSAKVTQPKKEKGHSPYPSF